MSDLKHFVVETTTRFHLYADSEETITKALELSAVNVEDTEDHEEAVVLKHESVPQDKLAQAEREGIPILTLVDGVLHVDGEAVVPVVQAVQTVQIIEDESSTTAIFAVPENVRAALTNAARHGTRRTCLWLDETSYDPEQVGFVPSFVEEGVAGHSPLAPNTPLGPVYLGPTFADAVRVVDAVNATVGITHSDMLDIVLSSMAASRKERS